MSNVPEKLKGSEFEQLLFDAAARHERAGRLTMGRYGVDGVVVKGRTLLVPSKPDFEGVLAFPAGRQFIIEAKVCAGSSFPLQKDKIKPRQVSHMLTRSRFGVSCWLMIHFTARKLVRITDPGITVAIPISPDDPRWQRYVDAHAEAKRSGNPVAPQGSITRDEAIDIGRVVRWEIPPRCKKALPDILPLLDPQGHLTAQPTLL